VKKKGNSINFENINQEEKEFLKNFLQNSLSQTQSIYDLFNMKQTQSLQSFQSLNWNGNGNYNINETENENAYGYAYSYSNKFFNFGEMFGLERENETKRKIGTSGLGVSKSKGKYSKININNNLTNEDLLEKEKLDKIDFKNNPFENEDFNTDLFTFDNFNSCFNNINNQGKTQTQYEFNLKNLKEMISLKPFKGKNKYIKLDGDIYLENEFPIYILNKIQKGNFLNLNLALNNPHENDNENYNDNDNDRECLEELIEKTVNINKIFSLNFSFFFFP
jgi:hypothetical protein